MTCQKGNLRSGAPEKGPSLENARMIFGREGGRWNVDYIICEGNQGFGLIYRY